MIGEIRDEASAAVALRAALTGHLVFATLHTSSAAGAVLRLENLGLPRNLIISVLKGVVVQELKAVGENVNLAADVSIPLKEIEQFIDKAAVESELEQCFEHNTNYMQVLERTLGILKTKHTETDLQVQKESLQLDRYSTVNKKSRKQILVQSQNKDEKEENAV